MQNIYYSSYLYIIMICVFFCFMVMVYNLSMRITQRRQENRRADLSASVRDLLLQCGAPEGETRDPARKLERILKKPYGLLALQNALQELGWNTPEDFPPAIRDSLCLIFIRHTKALRRQKEPSVLCLSLDLFIRCGFSSGQITSMALEKLEHQDLLVRIEALRYISAESSARQMFLAVDHVNQHFSDFSTKLISDVLVSFQGDRQELTRLLWEAFPSYIPQLQVAILQALTVMQDVSLARQIQSLLTSEDTDKETRIAAIKYFGAVRIPECVPMLSRFLDSPVWEYAALSAKSLRRYDCTGIFDSLSQGICSRNWYVRNNCAQTIVAACSKEQIRTACRSQDRYARDIMQYALDEREHQRGVS